MSQLGTITWNSAAEKRQVLRAESEHRISLLSATLLGMAMTNYFFYDRFALSYVLAERCAGCDAPAMSSYAGPALAAVPGGCAIVLRRVPAPDRRRWWAWVTGGAMAGGVAGYLLVDSSAPVRAE